MGRKTANEKNSEKGGGVDLVVGPTHCHNSRVIWLLDTSDGRSLALRSH